MRATLASLPVYLRQLNNPLRPSFVRILLSVLNLTLSRIKRLLETVATTRELTNEKQRDFNLKRGRNTFRYRVDTRTGCDYTPRCIELPRSVIILACTFDAIIRILRVIQECRACNLMNFQTNIWNNTNRGSYSKWRITEKVITLNVGPL